MVNSPDSSAQFCSTCTSAPSAHQHPVVGPDDSGPSARRRRLVLAQPHHGRRNRLLGQRRTGQRDQVDARQASRQFPDLADGPWRRSARMARRSGFPWTVDRHDGGNHARHRDGARRPSGCDIRRPQHLADGLDDVGHPLAGVGFGEARFRGEQRRLPAMPERRCRARCRTAPSLCRSCRCRSRSCAVLTA